MAFAFGRERPGIRVVQKELTITQSTCANITFAKPTSLEASIEELLTLKNLVALGVGKSLSWKSITAKFAVVSTEGGGSWANILDSPGCATCDEIIHPVEMLFTFSDIRHRLGQALDAWLRIGEEVKPLYMLYSATTRGQKLYSEHRLFNFFQALESYYRMRNEVDEQTKGKVKA